MRIEVTLAQGVPPHLCQTAERNGLEVVRVGSGFRVRIGAVLLRADDAVVRIEPDGPRQQAPPGGG